MRRKNIPRLVRRAGASNRRRSEDKSAVTINHALKVVRRILNLAAAEWADKNVLVWLLHAPRIRLLPDNNRRQPFKQRERFGELSG